MKRQALVLFFLMVATNVAAADLHRDAKNPDAAVRRPALEALAADDELDVIERALLELALRNSRTSLRYLDRKQGKLVLALDRRRQEIRMATLALVRSPEYLAGNSERQQEVADRLKDLRRLDTHPYTWLRSEVPQLGKLHGSLAEVLADAERWLGAGKKLPAKFLDVKQQFVRESGVILRVRRDHRLPPVPMDPAEVIQAHNAQFEADGFGDDERDAVERINAHRRLLGLGALRLDPKLVTICERHSSAMKNQEFFDHRAPPAGSPTPKQRCLAVGVTNYVAENIAHQAEPRAVVEGWIGSPVHHRNLLDPRAARVGLGRVGNLWTLDLAGPGK